MAAVTETLRVEYNIGNRRCVTATLASVDTTDTWDTGLTLVEFLSFTPTTSSAGSQWGATISGGTVTFNAESGQQTGRAMAIGI